MVQKRPHATRVARECGSGKQRQQPHTDPRVDYGELKQFQAREHPEHPAGEQPAEGAAEEVAAIAQWLKKRKGKRPRQQPQQQRRRPPGEHRQPGRFARGHIPAVIVHYGQVAQRRIEQRRVGVHRPGCVRCASAQDCAGDAIDEAAIGALRAGAKADQGQDALQWGAGAAVIGDGELPCIGKEGVKLGIGQVAQLAEDRYLRMVVEAPRFVGMAVIKAVAEKRGWRGELGGHLKTQASIPHGVVVAVGHGVTQRQFVDAVVDAFG